MAKIPEPNALHQCNGTQLWESPIGSSIMYNGEGLCLGLHVLQPDGSYLPVPLPSAPEVDIEHNDTHAEAVVNEDDHTQE